MIDIIFDIPIWGYLYIIFHIFCGFKFGKRISEETKIDYSNNFYWTDFLFCYFLGFVYGPFAWLGTMRSIDKK